MTHEQLWQLVDVLRKLPDNRYNQTRYGDCGCALAHASHAGIIASSDNSYIPNSAAVYGLGHTPEILAFFHNQWPTTRREKICQIVNYLMLGELLTIETIRASGLAELEEPADSFEPALSRSQPKPTSAQAPRQRQSVELAELVFD